MSVNKVVYGQETLIDISDSTVTPETLAQGETAYNASGAKIIGIMEASGGGSSLPDPITAGDTPVLFSCSVLDSTSSSYTDTHSLTIPIAGTYRFKWTAVRESTSGTQGTQILKNGAIIYTNTSWDVSDKYGQENSYDLECAAGDVIKIQAKSRGSMNYAVYVCELIACIDWDNGF